MGGFIIVPKPKPINKQRGHTLITYNRKFILGVDETQILEFALKRVGGSKGETWPVGVVEGLEMRGTPYPYASAFTHVNILADLTRRVDRVG